MKTMFRFVTIAMMLVLALVLAACGGNNAGGTSSGGTTGDASATTLELGSDGEQLVYDKTELSAPAGSAVTVRFQNNSAAQQHNWVLVNGDGTVADTVSEAGLTAGPDAGYLAAGDANVLANTPLANGGETVEVSFTAPPAGTYIYVCTVPGHSVLMRGTFTSQ
ncbi:auracyanin [Candidatus Gracilibacteria bacterium]|nr:auracyanin [Candidatus Gracilibacteria bacterium]